jgi:hypothetical protein
MKIKSILALSLFLFIAACNVPKEEDNVPTSKVELLTSLEDTGEDPAKTATAVEANEPAQNPEVRKAGPLPLLTARGSEPGWYAEFFADHAKLVLDYGKDTINIDHDFSNIIKDKTYTVKIANVTNDNGKKSSFGLVVNVESKPCTEASGDKREKSITLKYNSKEYKGCAY